MSYKYKLAFYKNLDIVVFKKVISTEGEIKARNN